MRQETVGGATMTEQVTRERSLVELTERIKPFLNFARAQIDKTPGRCPVVVEYRDLLGAWKRFINSLKVDEQCPKCGGKQDILATGVCPQCLTQDILSDADEMSATEGVLEDVLHERERQDEKWGEQNHGRYKWLAILAEELGEAAAAALKGETENYRKEMIQVAAVAVSAVESHDRPNQKDYPLPEKIGGPKQVGPNALEPEQVTFSGQDRPPCVGCDRGEQCMISDRARRDAENMAMPCVRACDWLREQREKGA